MLNAVSQPANCRDNWDEITRVAASQGVELGAGEKSLIQMRFAKATLLAVEPAKNKGMTETVAREQLHTVLWHPTLEQDDVYGLVSGGNAAQHREHHPSAAAADQNCTG